MIRVLFVPADRAGCGEYRINQVFSQYMYTDSEIDPTWTFNKILKCKADVVFTRGLVKKEAFEALLKYREHEKCKVVIDYDDDVISDKSDLPKFSKILRGMETKENRKAMKELLSDVADLVTVSTEHLKIVMSEIYPADRIRVIPNYLSIRDWAYDRTAAIPLERSFYYQGSSTHYDNESKSYGDFDIPLAKYLQNKRVIYQGDDCPWFLDSAISVPWVPISRYSRCCYENSRYAQFTLAPLCPCKFNRSKSDLKYLESCAIGRVCLCSSFEGSPYSGADELQKIPYGCSISDIDRIVSNAYEQYSEILEHQYQYLNDRWLDNNIDKYTELFKEAMDVR